MYIKASSIIDLYNPSWSGSSSDGAYSEEHANSVKKVKECAFFDTEMTGLTNNFLGATMNLCPLIGKEAVKHVPLLAILCSPLALLHAVKRSVSHFKVLKVAAKTKRFAEILFWGCTGISSFGNALGAVAMPLAGVATLVGFAKIPAIALSFNLIIPAILFVFSVIGTGAQIGSLADSWKALREVKELRKMQDGSLRNLKKLLEALQNPQWKPDNGQKMQKENLFLDYRAFENARFISPDNLKDLDTRIQKLLRLPKLPMVESFGKTLDKLPPSFKIPFRKKNPILDEPFGLDSIEDSLQLCDNLLSMVKDWNSAGVNDQLLKELRESKKSLEELKQKILEEGMDIADMAHSELHRRFLDLQAGLLVTAIALISSIFFIAFPSYVSTAHILALSASALNSLTLIFNKSISSEKFLKYERRLGILRERKVISF
jgi:hypothetical protein